MAEVDGLVYRNTTGDFTGKVGDVPLTSLEGDYNNFKVKTDVTAIFTQLSAVGAGISDITQPTSNTLLITLADSTVFGPFTLPTAPMTGRGLWLPSVSYAVNDLLYYGTAIYVVPFAHTSDTAFDAGANDGMGNNFYDLIFDFAVSSPALRQATTAPESSVTHTVSSSDLNTLLLCTNTAGCDVTIPPDSTYDAPIDTEISFRQSAAGPLTFTATAPATFNSGVGAFENATEDLGAVITIKKTAANTWVGFGRFAEPTV